MGTLNLAFLYKLSMYVPCPLMLLKKPDFLKDFMEVPINNGTLYDAGASLLTIACLHNKPAVETNNIC